MDKSLLESNNYKLLIALKASLGMLSGDFHILELNMSAKELIEQVEKENDASK